MDPRQFTQDQLRAALSLTGQLLEERSLSFEIVVIGGANLVLQGLVTRPTVDVVVVALRADTSDGYECAKPLPDPLRIAVEDSAELLALPPRWMNGTASSDFELGLPPGFDERTAVEQFGGLRVAFAHRRDIVAWKLQAAVDRWGDADSERHFQDLVRLQPQADEIGAARAWFETVEAPGSGFFQNLEAVLGRLGAE